MKGGVDVLGQDVGVVIGQLAQGQLVHQRRPGLLCGKMLGKCQIWRSHLQALGGDAAVGRSCSVRVSAVRRATGQRLSFWEVSAWAVAHASWVPRVLGMLQQVSAQALASGREWMVRKRFFWSFWELSSRV